MGSRRRRRRRRLTATAATRSQSALPHTHTQTQCEGGPSFELRQLECFSFSLQFFAAPTTQAYAARHRRVH